MTKPKVDPGGARQSRTYLMEMLQANGLRPRRQLGQNFLIDFNLLDLLTDVAHLSETDVVLEIGAGTGGLTSRLAERAGRVVSVEIDSGFFELAKQETAGCENLTLLPVDALANKNRMNPDVMQAVRSAMKEQGADHYHLVANLPYDVASSVIANLLLDETPIRTMTVTIQLEFGARMVARPNTKHYGPLSVLIATVGRSRWIRSLPPHVFWPRPKVRSAIVKAYVDDDKRSDIAGLRQFHHFVRQLFTHRRKNLRAAVSAIPGYKKTKKHLDQLLPSLGLDVSMRAEQLSAEQLAALFDALLKVVAE